MTPTQSYMTVQRTCAMDSGAASISTPIRARGFDRLKPKIDFAIALILFLLAFPIVAIAGCLVVLTSNGPVFYRQTRVGQFGRPFRIWKIRTMRHNCEAASGAKWSSKGDQRVTVVGRFLRMTHIDELPQIWNILCGDMSLIGPRPERPEFIAYLEKALEGYRGRLAVKPGVTGLAQIQLPPDSNLMSVRQKLALDLVYVERRGLWLDLRLAIGTMLYLIGFSFATVRTAMSLPGASEVPTLLVNETEASQTGQCLATPVVGAFILESPREPQMSSL